MPPLTQHSICEVVENSYLRIGVRRTLDRRWYVYCRGREASAGTWPVVDDNLLAPTPIRGASAHDGSPARLQPRVVRWPGPDPSFDLDPRGHRRRSDDLLAPDRGYVPPSPFDLRPRIAFFNRTPSRSLADAGDRLGACRPATFPWHF